MARLQSTKHSASWWLVVIAGGMVVIFSVAIVREIFRTRQIRHQVAQLRSDIATEEQRHGQLKELIAYLSSPTFQEREARLQLGLKKAGERVLVVPTNGQSGDQAPNFGSAQPVATPPSIPTRWWEYFFPPDRKG